MWSEKKIYDVPVDSYWKQKTKSCGTGTYENVLFFLLLLLLPGVALVQLLVQRQVLVNRLLSRHQLLLLLQELLLLLLIQLLLLLVQLLLLLIQLLLCYEDLSLILINWLRLLLLLVLLCL